MASVFLSYDHEDEDQAVSIMSALKKAGHDVWWDRHIRGGAQYNSEIEDAVANADVVVVLWSEQATQSAWVRDEAAEGRDRGKLVPVQLDGAKPPMGFRQFQTIDLSNARGRKRTARLKELFAAVEKFGGGTAIQAPVPFRSRFRLDSRLAWTAGAVAVLVLFAAAAFLLVRGRGRSSVQTVAVLAVDPAARPLARDLLVNLATLRSAKSGSMRLIDGAGTKGRADLVFEVGGDIRSRAPAESLVLMTGKDRSILWSEDFEQKPGGADNLKQRAGYTAARVLGCALEALSPKNGRLRQGQLKLYLNACALLDESFFADTSQVIAMLKKVVTDAPGFEPAWASLLVAETNHYQSLSNTGRTGAAGDFRRTIAAARAANPDIAEAYIAEIELLPGGAFYDQVQLANRAVRADPDNEFVLAGRSLVMLCVGRLEEAVEDARMAASINPLSPAIRSSYIQALIYSGHVEAARSELAEAERLWPDATTTIDSRYRLDLRYGDTAEVANALTLMRSGKVQSGRMREAFAQARLNPTPSNINRAVDLAMLTHNTQPELDATGEVILTLGEFDRTDELMKFLLAWNDPSQVPYFVEILFRPPLADVRADPRFMQVAARLGLLDYWRRSGDWPDFCADPALPYDCKKEASKLTP